MGYEVHITLAEDWMSSESKPITEAAWQAVLVADPSLEARPDDYELRRDGSAGTTVRIHPVVWTAHPATPAFWFSKGRVTVTNPDARTLKKMKEIAVSLGARVFGDEGEEY